MIRVLLVDDQRMVREALRGMLQPDPEFEVVGTASDGYTAIEQLEILKPDVVLVDMEMPGLNGAEVTQIISKHAPNTKVLVLSMHDSDEHVNKALGAGAAGYLLKITPASQVRAAIRFIYRGDPKFDPQVFLTPSGAANGHVEVNGQAIATAPREVLAEPEVRASSTTVVPVNGSPPTALTSLSLSDFPETSEAEDLPPPPWKRYLAIGLASNLLIWGLSLAYLGLRAPEYQSKWTVTLPGTSISAKVDLPGIGEASSESESPYSGNVSDPRENYKDLAQSSEVLDIAAESIGLASAEFGKPRIQIVDNTTLIRFSIAAQQPQLAKAKALAFHDALQLRLNQLRKEEVSQLESGLQDLLDEAKEKLTLAQSRLSAFQTRTGLNSSEQLRDLSSSIENIRRQKVETVAQLQEVSSRFQQLSRSLGLSPAEAADAFVLQSDPLLQQYVADLSQANASLTNLRSQYNERHPLVVEKQAEVAAAQAALNRQVQLVLGRPVSRAALQRLSLNNSEGGSSDRSALLQQLISQETQKRGLSQQAQSFDQQIAQLEARLKSLSLQNSTLTTLERDVQIAEAVFSSTLTRLDISKANASAAYPPIAMTSPPSLPSEPSSPSAKLVLLGALLGSSLVSIGSWLLWQQQKRSAYIDAPETNGLPRLPEPS